MALSKVHYRRNDRSSSRRGRPSRALRVVVAGLLAFALATSFASAQLGRGKLKGTVSLEDGTPLEATLVLEPGEGVAATPRNYKLKKGRFSQGFMIAGEYSVRLESEDYFLMFMSYRCVTSTGVVEKEFESGASPEEGLPPFRVMPGLTCEIELTAAPASERDRFQRQAAVAEARGPLKELADLYDQGDWDTLIVRADELLVDEPELAPAHYLRGVALGEAGRLDEGIKAIERAIELEIEQPGIGNVLGSMFMKKAKREESLGREDRAARAYANAADALEGELSESPDSKVLITNLAAALLGAGRRDDAVPHLETLLERDPDNIPVRFQLATIYREQGDNEKAIALLEALSSDDAEAAKVVYNVATELYNEKQYEQALLAVNKAQAIDPDLHLARRLEGYILLAMGRRDEAVVELQAFLEAEPDHPEAGNDRAIVEALTAK